MLLLAISSLSTNYYLYTYIVFGEAKLVSEKIFLFLYLNHDFTTAHHRAKSFHLFLQI